MPWITIDEAAADAGCSVRTMQRRMSAGTVPTKREGGRVLVELPAAQRHPVRHLADVATANTVQLSAITESYRDAVNVATKDRWQAQRDGQIARRDARIAILVAFVVVTTAGLVAVKGVIHYRDRIDASQRIHTAEKAVLLADHVDVVLTLERRVATADGVAQARSDELELARDRLESAVRDRDKAISAARGERSDGTPILLAAEP